MPNKELEPVLIWAGAEDLHSTRHFSVVMPIKDDHEQRWLDGITDAWRKTDAAMAALQNAAKMLGTEPMGVPKRLLEMQPLLKRVEEIKDVDKLRATIEQLEARAADLAAQNERLRGTTIAKLLGETMDALAGVAKALEHDLDVSTPLPDHARLLVKKIGEIKQGSVQ